MISGHIAGIGDYRIAPLDLGQLTVPAGTPMGGRTLAVQGFLITHPDGALLFDTGLGAESPSFDHILAPITRRSLDEAFAALDHKDQQR